MSCLPLSCFGSLFQRRRKEIYISAPTESRPETATAPRLTRLPVTIPPTTVAPPTNILRNAGGSMRSPTASVFRRPSNASTAMRSPGLRQGGLAYPQPAYQGISNYNNIPTHHAHKPSIASVASMGSSSRGSPQIQDAINLLDEKRSFEKKSTDLLRSPKSPEFPTDFDTTPRFHKIFKIFGTPSGSSSNITFTQAVKTAPKVAENEAAAASTHSLPRKFSQRFSRYWTASHHHQQQQQPGVGDVPPMPERPVARRPPLPVSPRNGLGQCLTTRMPNGDVKPVTMVPQLKLQVPNDPVNRKATPTPIEASPVNDPWRYTKCEIEGLSDNHQAWML